MHFATSTCNILSAIPTISLTPNTIFCSIFRSIFQSSIFNFPVPLYLSANLGGIPPCIAGRDNEIT